MSTSALVNGSAKLCSARLHTKWLLWDVHRIFSHCYTISSVTRLYRYHCICQVQDTTRVHFCIDRKCLIIHFVHQNLHLPIPSCCFALGNPRSAKFPSVLQVAKVCQITYLFNSRINIAYLISNKSPQCISEVSISMLCKAWEYTFDLKTLFAKREVRKG